MTSRDQHRSAVYAAETTLGRMLDNCAESGNPMVTIDAIPLTLPLRPDSPPPRTSSATSTG